MHCLIYCANGVCALLSWLVRRGTFKLLTVSSKQVRCYKSVWFSRRRTVHCRVTPLKSIKRLHVYTAATKPKPRPHSEV